MTLHKEQNKAQFPLPELTARVNGPSWPVTGFHYYGRAFPLAELTGRVDGPSTRLVETHARQHGPCWRVMETGHPSTRVVETGLNSVC